MVVASLHFFISWKYQQTPEASKKKKNGKNQTGRATAGKGAADFYASYVAPVTSCVYNNLKAGLLNSFDVSTLSMKVALALSAKPRLTGITIHLSLHSKTAVKIDNTILKITRKQLEHR